MKTIELLFSAAVAARAQAYAPYSGFSVGAALRTPSGAIFSGANVENAAYPVGICAEAAAIAAMVVAGERQIAEILIIGEGAALVTPCGACRQRIFEFASEGRTDSCRRAGWRPRRVHDRGAVAARFWPKHRETAELSRNLKTGFGRRLLKITI